MTSLVSLLISACLASAAEGTAPASAPSAIDPGKAFFLNAQWWEIGRGSVVTKHGSSYALGHWTVWSGLTVALRYSGGGPWAEATGGFFDLAAPGVFTGGFEAGWRFYLHRKDEIVDQAALLVGAHWFGFAANEDRSLFHGEGALASTSGFWVPTISVIRGNHETMRRIAFYYRLSMGLNPKTGKPMILFEDNASVFSANWWYAPDVFGSAGVVGAGVGLRL